MVSPHFLDRDENFAIRRVPRYWDPTYAINNISKQTSFSSHVWRVEDSVGIRTAKSGEPDGYYIYTPDKQFSTGPFLQWQLEEIFQWRLSPDIYSRGYPHESNTLEHPVPPKSPASVVSTLPNGVYNRYCDFIIITIPKSFNPKWSLRLTDSRVFDGGDGVVWEPHMGVRLQYVNNDDKSGKYEMVDLDMKYVSEELTEKQVNEIFGIHISGGHFKNKGDTTVPYKSAPSKPKVSETKKSSPKDIKIPYCMMTIVKIPPDFDDHYSYNIEDDEELEDGEGMVWYPGMRVYLQHFDGHDDSYNYEILDMYREYVSFELTPEQVEEMFAIKSVRNLEFLTDAQRAALPKIGYKAPALSYNPCAEIMLPTSKPTASDIAKPKTSDIIDKVKSNMYKKEGSSMKFNFLKDFGAITDGSVALTINGQIAVRRGVDEYVRYDVKGKNIENQMSLVIKEAADMIYIIPVTEVAVGDILKVKDSYCQVISIDKEGALKVANYKTGTTSNVLKETNIFGFNLYYKVVSLFDQTNNKTAAGFNPMMLMLLSDKTGGSGKMDKLLPLMLMSNTTGTAGIPQPKLDKDGKPVVDKDGKLIYDTVPVPANPMAQMLPLMLMGGDGGFDMKDMLMMQMLGGQGGMFGGAAGGQGINPMMLMCLMDKSNSGGKKVPF